jgi:integral membrane protein
MNEKLFILLGRLEGLSLLILMLVAMPMKYIMHEPEMVKYTGRAHGGLFLAYVIAAAAISDAQNWDKKKLRMSWILSCVPFGTFIFEKKYMSTKTSAV